MSIVELDRISKKYNDFYAVDQLSLTIEEGSIYGLLGPNGAGKSTTMNMICNNIRPTGGDINLFGLKVKNNFDKVSFRIGLVPQKIALYLKLSGVENVEFFARLQGFHGEKLRKAVKAAVEFAALEGFKDKPAKEYSGGMLRRLNIACGIVHQPELIIMDEPTVGIDTQSRNHILESIKNLNKRGATVIYCSHYMEEVDYLCDHIGIIDHGKLLIAGSKEEINRKVKMQKVTKITIDSPRDIREELMGIEGVDAVEQHQNELSISSSLHSKHLNTIFHCIDKLEIGILDVEQNKASLEDVFLTLTGKDLRE